MAADANIGTLKGGLELEDSFSKDLEKVSGSGGAIGKFKTAFAAVTVVAAAVVAGVAAVTAGIVKLGQRGAAVGDVQVAFERLNKAVGNVADDAIAGLRAGVQGTINDFDLMKSANTALSAGFKGTADNFETVAAASRVLAKQNGGDTLKTFELLTKSMASGRVMGLKTIGVFVDQKKVLEDYADQLGITTGDISDSTRAQLLQNAALEVLEQKVTEAGIGVRDFGEQIEAAKVFFQNLNDQLSVGIADSPVLAAAMQGIGDAFTEAFGGDKEELVATIVGIIEDMAIKFVDVAVFVLEFGSVASTVFFKVQELVFGAIGVIGDLVIGFEDMLIKMFDIAAKLPGIGGQFAAMADEVRRLRDIDIAMTQSYKDTAEAARASSVKWKAGISTVQGALMDVKGAMLTAREEQEASIDVNEEAIGVGDDLTETVEEMGGAFKATKEEIDAANGAMDEAVKFWEEARDRANDWLDVGLDEDLRSMNVSWDMLTEAQLENELVMERIAKDLITLRDRGGELTFAQNLLADSYDRTTTALIPVQADLATMLDTLPKLHAETMPEGRGFFDRFKDSFTSFSTEFSMDGLVSALGGGMQAMTNLVGGFFGSEGVSGSFANLAQQGLTFALNTIVPGLGAISGLLIRGLSSIGSKVKGFFRSLFGGPSDAELAGREVGNAFMDSVLAQLDPASFDEINELVQQGWDRRLAQFAVGMGDMFEAVGRSQEEANEFTSRMWDAMKEGPAAVEAVIAEIEAITGKGQEFADAFEDSMGQAGAAADNTADSIAGVGDAATGSATGILSLEAGKDVIDALKMGFDAIIAKLDEVFGTTTKMSDKVFKKKVPADAKAMRKGVTEESSAMKDSVIADQGEVAKAFEEVPRQAEEGFEIVKKEANESAIKMEDDLTRSAMNSGINIANSVAEGINFAANSVRNAVSDMENQLFRLGSMELNIPVAITKTVTTSGSTGSFSLAGGTPNFDFNDFGQRSVGELHNREAVVPESGVGDFATQVASVLSELIGGGGPSGGVIFAEGAVQISALDANNASDILRRTVSEIVTDSMESQDRTGVRLQSAARTATR